jgi:hypothetical protein
MRIIIAEGDLRRDEVEAGHMADGLVYTAGRTLRERGERVPFELEGEVERKIVGVRPALHRVRAGKRALPYQLMYD